MFDILELNLSSIGEGNWYTSLIESQRHVGSTPTLCIRVCRELVYRGISKILGFVDSNPTIPIVVYLYKKRYTELYREYRHW